MRFHTREVHTHPEIGLVLGVLCLSRSLHTMTRTFPWCSKASRAQIAGKPVSELLREVLRMTWWRKDGGKLVGLAGWEEKGSMS